jgi:hypothetical protein
MLLLLFVFLFFCHALSERGFVFPPDGSTFVWPTMKQPAQQRLTFRLKNSEAAIRT